MVLLRLREGSDRVLVICDFLFSILCACRCPLVSLRACVMAMAAGSVSVGGRTGWLGRSLLVGCGLPRIRGRGRE